MGVIGTLGESWSYILQDGTGSIRQLVTPDGAVALSIAYTPWGDTLEIYGSGMLNLGYLGGVYDAGTGLIYMGNGQYYDPSTGRFLTRGAKPEQSNPYTPWNSDPAGMLVAPLALLVMVFGYKKNKTKFDQFIILLVIAVSLGLSVSACAGGVPTAIPTSKPTETPTATDTPPADANDAGSATVSGSIATAQPGANESNMDDCNHGSIRITLTPTLTITMTFTPTATSTQTSVPTSTPVRSKEEQIEFDYNISIKGNWALEWLGYLEEAFIDVNHKLSEYGLSFSDIYTNDDGTLFMFQMGCPYCSGWGKTHNNYIEFKQLYTPSEEGKRDPTASARLIIHELGHAFDYKVCEKLYGKCPDITALANSDVRMDLTSAQYNQEVNFTNIGLLKRYDGDRIARNSYGKDTDKPKYSGFNGGFEVWQFAMEGSIMQQGEIWADMFLGWTYQNLGSDRQEYMNDAMQNYLILFN